MGGGLEATWRSRNSLTGQHGEGGEQNSVRTAPMSQELSAVSKLAHVAPRSVWSRWLLGFLIAIG
jgi:hypothetical protein